MRTRFPETSGLSAGAAAARAELAVTPEAQLARDYVEKIFQVPYRLPPVVAEQLNDLLEAMYHEADLSPGQLEDFRQRVAAHLQYVAVRRRRPDQALVAGSHRLTLIPRVVAVPRPREESPRRRSMA